MTKEGVMKRRFNVLWVVASLAMLTSGCAIREVGKIIQWTLEENLSLKAGAGGGARGKAIVLNEGLDLRDGRAHVDGVVPIVSAGVLVAGPVVRGRVAWVHKNALGQVLRAFEGPNLVVSAGSAGVASRINGAGGEAAFAWIAIGTGATAAAAGDTTLQTEISTSGGQRAACTTSRVTTDVTNDTAQCVVTFNFTGSFAVTESGYLNATSAGTLLSRQVFSAINVVNGDSLQVTWKIDVD